MISRTSFLSLILLTVWASPARCQESRQSLPLPIEPGQRIRIQMKTGEVSGGRLVSLEGETIGIADPDLGERWYRWDAVEGISASNGTRMEVFRRETRKGFLVFGAVGAVQLGIYSYGHGTGTFVALTLFGFLGYGISYGSAYGAVRALFHSPGWVDVPLPTPALDSGGRASFQWSIPVG